ncbi:hypothetical protein HZH68_010727 [Vespula germanica]|uniref:Uncharacterized protein n=1 Tax=Vespula germanica TaxID=30212 RepID=A0A834JSE8_VESGE|nr:hypothetical protein HZH68_010727 [Vespula germanica]
MKEEEKEEEEEEGSESVVARRKGCFQNALCIPTQKLQLQCIQRGHSSNIPISRFAWRTIPSRAAAAVAAESVATTEMVAASVITAITIKSR